MKSSSTATPLIVLFPIGLLLLLFVFAWYLPLNSNQHNLKSLIVVDLLLTLPIIYFVCVRKTRIPASTTISFTVLSVALFLIALPAQNTRELKSLVYALLPALEVTIAVFVIWKVRRASIHPALKNLDNYEKIRFVLGQLFPERIAAAIASEFAVLYYAIWRWRSVPLKEEEYAYHAKSSVPGLAYGLSVIVFMETIGLHFIMLIFSELVAWVVTGLSIYTLFQLIGIAKGFSKRPASFDPQGMTLRYSLLSNCRIPYADISSIKINRGAMDKNSIKLSPLGELEPHNIELTLFRPCTVFGYMGSKKSASKIVFNLDEPTRFIEDVKKHMKQ